MSGSLCEHLGQGLYHVYSYDWLTGPNPGYGFGSSGPQQSMQEHHRQPLLPRRIDPDTGYLGEP